MIERMNNKNKNTKTNFSIDEEDVDANKNEFYVNNKRYFLKLRGICIYILYH